MENKYNVLITYAGDGEFKFIIKKIGEVSISKLKPIYIYNVDAGVINDLRTLKRLLLNVTIGAKPTGAYKIYDFDDFTSMPKAVIGQRPNVVKAEPVSNGEIASILKGGSQAPIEEPEVKVEEPKTEEPKVEEPKEDEAKEPETKPEEDKKEEKKPAAKKKSASKKKTSKKK
jgi:hypothetical protein